MVLGYIGAGVVFGNLFPHVSDRSFLQLIADSGMTLLLFTLGIEFAFQRLRSILGTITWAVIAQILFVWGISFFVFLFFRFPFLAASYIATAASLSSTALVVKILTEKGELETIPGEVSTGWLVVQDLAVIPFLILLSVVTTISSHELSALGIVSLVSLGLGKAVLALTVIIFLGKSFVPRLLQAVARFGSREILLLTTIVIVFLSALLCFLLGLSAALGAFIAGLVVAQTSQHHAIFAEIRPLRDIFSIVFFVTLGMIVPLSFLWQNGLLLIGVVAIVVFLKWFLVVGLSRYLGYHKKTAFLVALSLIPMSEFGFVLAQEGLRSGALTGEHYVFLVALTFATIVVGTPLLSHGHAVYYWFFKTLGARWPKLFTTNEPLISTTEPFVLNDHIVICGYGRVGKYIGRALEMAGMPFVVVDYNHTTLEGLKAHGITVLYGDPADKDVLAVAQLGAARAIVIAIPDRHTQELVIGHAQTMNRRIHIICRTHHEEDQRLLKSLGVGTIVQPEFEAALSIVGRLLSEFGVSPDDISGKITRLKIEHGLG